MRRRRVFEGELNGYASVVRGPGVAEIVQRITGRRPTWVYLIRGYSVSERTLRDAAALAEVLHYDVVLTGARASRKARLFETLDAAPARRAATWADGPGGLW